MRYYECPDCGFTTLFKDEDLTEHNCKGDEK